jgi:hypothetical protein
MRKAVLTAVLLVVASIARAEVQALADLDPVGPSWSTRRTSPRPGSAACTSSWRRSSAALRFQPTRSR